MLKRERERDSLLSSIRKSKAFLKRYFPQLYFEVSYFNYLCTNQRGKREKQKSSLQNTTLHKKEFNLHQNNN